MSFATPECKMDRRLKPDHVMIWLNVLYCLLNIEDFIVPAACALKRPRSSCGLILRCAKTPTGFSAAFLGLRKKLPSLPLAGDLAICA
jgi:hypothetical protein